MALGDTNESLGEIEDNMNDAEDKEDETEEDEQKDDGAESCPPKASIAQEAVLDCMGCMPTVVSWLLCRD